PVVAVAMGTITATFGGIIRDILGGETPVILSREIYVTAAVLAAAVFVLCISLGVPREMSIASGFVVGVVVRGAALIWGWTLPRYRPRPGK
ncbi:MAG: TRIC cation channel family protein, partial [Pseudomonadota bacterium]